MNAPKRECEFKIDLYIGYYSHHILRIMCGFFNIPLNMQGCETGSTVYLSHARRLESLAVCRCHCKSNRVSLVILRPRVLVWPGFEPSTSCLAYRRLSNRAAVSSKISGFRYNAMFTFMIFILTFSLCSRFGFISSCCFCSLWIQPCWHPSGDTPFFVLINSILGSSPDLQNHHDRVSSTVSNTGGSLGSDP